MQAPTTFTLLLAFIIVAADLPGQINGAQPGLEPSHLFREASIAILQPENLINKLSRQFVAPGTTLYTLSLASDKGRELVGDKTIRSFIDLNKFSLDQCKQAALSRRAQFCQDLMPQVVKRHFDMEENLRLYCRKTIFLVAENCVRLGDRYADELEISFIKSIGEILSQMKLEMARPDHLSSIAAARYRPTSLEGYLLEESGEN